MVSPPIGAGDLCTGNADAAQLPDARPCPDNRAASRADFSPSPLAHSSDARAARRQRLPRAADGQGRRPPARTRPHRPSVPAPLGGAADRRRRGPARRRRRAPRQAHRLRLRRRSLRRRPPDDRRPAALARAGQDDGAQRARLLRVRQRHARAHRGGQAAARLAARGRGSRRAGRARRRRHRRHERRRRDGVRGQARGREPHRQARAHRSAPVQRHRQCVLGRDPAPRPAVAAGADAIARRRGDRSPVRGDDRDARRMERAPARARPATGRRR